MTLLTSAAEALDFRAKFAGSLPGVPELEHDADEQRDRGHGPSVIKHAHQTARTLTSRQLNGRCVMAITDAAVAHG